MKEKTYRGILFFWTLFIGLGALGGGVCMELDPGGKMMGMDATLPYFQVLPFAKVVFQDFTFSGIALIIVNGLTQLFSFYLLKTRKPFASRMCCISGIVLMLWICIQFYIFPLNFMSTAYFIFGFLEALCAVFLIKKEGEKA